MSSTCNSATIDFIVKQDYPEMEAVKDYIRQNLKEIGVTVNTLFLNDEE